MTDRLLRWCAGLCLPLVLAACNHDDLCYNHPHTARVRVDVDWHYFEKYETPTGMTVTLFPDNGAEPFKTITGTIDHAVMNLPVGTYHALVFNQSESEFGSFTFRDMNSAESAVVAVERSTRWYTRAKGELVAAESEWLGVGNFSHAEVTQAMLDAQAKHNAADASRTGEPVIAEVVPRNILQTVIVRVHMSGINNLRSARAALTGLSEGYMLTKGRKLDSKVTYLLESFSVVNDDNAYGSGYIEARISCFGLPGNHSARPEDNDLDLELLLIDNQTVVTYDIPVGDRFVEVERKVYQPAATDGSGGESDYELCLDLLVEVYVDANGNPIVLPDVNPAESGSPSGFDATVEDWVIADRQDISI